MDCPLVLGKNLQEGPKVGDADEQLSSRADLEKPSLEAEDEAAVPPPPSASCAGACSYHIVFSASYAVPVLLFDARDPGALLSTLHNCVLVSCANHRAVLLPSNRGVGCCMMCMHDVLGADTGPSSFSIEYQLITAEVVDRLSRF